MIDSIELDIKTPRWCLPALKPKRYKGYKGGRGSGKSHFCAEGLVEQHILNPDFRSVGIREVQKSIKNSSMLLITDKIIQLGVEHYFHITNTEIRNRFGTGVIAFQGMQDHTAESIKSLEGFDLAWVDEAQSLSKRSMELLLPTIRKESSEIWFSWNPEIEKLPVEELFQVGEDIIGQKLVETEDTVCIHVNYLDNPFIPKTLLQEAERHRRNNPDTFDHVWLGGYATKHEAQVFADKYEVKEFDVEDSHGAPLHGMDFGFANDPTTGTRLYIRSNVLYISREAYKTKLEIDDTPKYLKAEIPGIENYTVRADNARPESISYIRRNGIPKIQSVDKWPGSIKDGIAYINSFDNIIIHPRCVETAREFRLYSYKVDKRTGDVLPDIVDKYNHIIDGVRYALAPLIKAPAGVFIGRADDEDIQEETPIGKSAFSLQIGKG